MIVCPVAGRTSIQRKGSNEKTLETPQSTHAVHPQDTMDDRQGVSYEKEVEIEEAQEEENLIDEQQNN